MAKKVKTKKTKSKIKTKVSKPKSKAVVKSPYSKKELVTIRKTLVTKKAQILEDFVKLEGDTLNRSSKDASGDLSSYTFHIADMATDLYEREFSLELAEEERERLFALDDAIRRVDEGKYGRCDLCGGAISKQRLKAVPQAECCIECQEKEEKKTASR